MGFNIICVADFHQGSEGLPQDARGLQCVPSCLMYLFTVAVCSSPNNINTCDLNDILFAGSYLYCAMLSSGATSGLTDPSNLPKRISYKGKVRTIQNEVVMSGFLIHNSNIDEHNCFSLEVALSRACTYDSNFIIVLNGVSVGIHYFNSVFYVFDSHSRNKEGLSCQNGHCVFGYMKSIQDLCVYLQTLTVSISARASLCNMQFDLHVFAIRTRCKNNPSPFTVQITLNRKHGFKLYRFKRKSSEVSPSEITNASKVKKLMSGKQFSYVLDDVHVLSNKECVASGSTPEFDAGCMKANVGDTSMTTQCNLSYQSTGTVEQVPTLMNGHNSAGVVNDWHLNDSQIQMLYSVFNTLVASGPDYVCSCCTQILFKHSVKKVSRLVSPEKNQLPKFLTGYKSVAESEWLCSTCWSSIKKGRTPQCWLHNGLNFPRKPKELDLTNLEERLVSPRLPFMQLREMPRGGQINLKGNIVNVPADVNRTIKSLPRMVDETETIMLKLKRKLSYKHHVAFENIRPNKVFEAARWLVENSELFKNEDIVVDETWLYKSAGMSMIDEIPPSSEDNESSLPTRDTWTEDDDDFLERPTGNLDTFLQSIDFRDFNQVLCVAPGENSCPIGLFHDIHSEALSFPAIFCGCKRTSNAERVVPVHYSTICKWELRNVDRRAALCVPNIFFKLKRLQIKQIRDKVWLAVRKCKTKCQTFTAGDILSPGFVDTLTMQNDGYRVLRNIRGSPPYWEQAKRDVFALIRQLGIPTWFCSFSAAETKWEPLLRTLSKFVNGTDLSSEDINGLTWQEKCTLIKSDPVTCARYFDFRFQTFMKHVMKNKLHPVGEIVDFFYRVEFQQRGSPHIHMLLWVKDSPINEVSTDSEVSSFVDKYVSCSKDETMQTLINYQTHRHARTCRKKGKAICRFNFPVPPMPKTAVLHPLETLEQRKEYSKKYEKVVACLNDMYQKEPNLSFNDFLIQVGMNFEDYVMAIRSVLDRSKVFLKRSLSECRINNYNKTLMKCWQANMDIQYIFDPYACVSYIVSYISKGQRGLSNLLHDACQEANELDSDIRQQVRRIGNQFLSSVEIGAQEAAYLVLQMPLRRCSRDVIYVDTNKPEDRTALLKSINDLKQLPVNSKNVEMDSVLKRYKRRPRELNSICYADFSSWYELCARQEPSEKVTVSPVEDELPEYEYEHDTADDLHHDKKEDKGKLIAFPCGLHVRKRLTQKVIYTHCTPVNKDKEEHFREKIMLYTHWRSETDLIQGHASYEDSFLAKHDEICKNKVHYEKVDGNTLDQVILESNHLNTDDLNPLVHPEAQHQELIDEDEGLTASQNFGCFDPGLAPGRNVDSYDIGPDLGVGRKQISSDVFPHKELENDKYLQSVRCLNSEQKRFFYHILHRVKTKSVPFYTFLSGGAGVGKSVLIRNLHQAILKYYAHLRDEDPNSVKVLLCAPTGKAAHNIGGSTIHSAFSIPVSQGFKFKPLDMQQLNTLRAQFHDLKVVIIDEILMVGRGMMNFINLRLQELMGVNKSFGGVSILAVGDLFQLKPVLDSWIFSQVFKSPQLGCLSINVWIDLFDFFELQEVMRQKDDKEFALLLNRLREGQHTDDDVSTLKSRQIDSLGITCDIVKHLPHLFCRKLDATNHNISVLADMHPSQLENIESFDTVSGDLTCHLREKILLKIPDDPNKTMGLKKVLSLALGVPCELCLNVDTTDGLTNHGAPCIIKKFDFRVENSTRCSIVWVQFENNSIGSAWRSKYKHLYRSDILAIWTPILETTRHFTIQYFKTYLINRRQFPIHVSAGKTIHKSQGSTLKEAVVHFGTRKVEHAHYVGLSRVTSLTGIYILELNCEKISVSSAVEEEMNRLRTSQKLIEQMPDLKKSGLDNLKICFQNCRSLRKHIEDIQNEHNMLQADVVGFVETRVCNQVELNLKCQIDGFNVDGSTPDISSHGIAVYNRNCVLSVAFHNFEGIECAVTQISRELVVCFVYCPPRKATVAKYKGFLANLMKVVPQNEQLVLMGDFNFNYCEEHLISELFENVYRLKQLINVKTTDHDTSLDHIYTNIRTHQVKAYGTLESYYSDHKALYLVLLR